MVFHLHWNMEKHRKIHEKWASDLRCRRVPPDVPILGMRIYPPDKFILDTFSFQVNENQASEFILGINQKGGHFTELDLPKSKSDSDSELDSRSDQESDSCSESRLESDYQSQTEPAEKPCSDLLPRYNSEPVFSDSKAGNCPSNPEIPLGYSGRESRRMKNLHEHGRFAKAGKFFYENSQCEKNRPSLSATSPRALGGEKVQQCKNQ